MSSSQTAKQFVIIRQPQDVPIDFNKILVNSVVACLYEETGEWYLATVTEKYNENSEINVQFFKPSGHEAELQGSQAAQGYPLDIQVIFQRISHGISLVISRCRSR